MDLFDRHLNNFDLCGNIFGVENQDSLNCLAESCVELVRTGISKNEYDGRHSAPKHCKMREFVLLVAACSVKGQPRQGLSVYRPWCGSQLRWCVFSQVSMICVS